MFKTVIVGTAGGAGDADAQALATLLAARDAELIPTRIEQGPVGRGLHAAAAERGADLIVVGSSRRSLLNRILAGDDVRATLRAAPCAVAVAPKGFAAAPATITRVGVGYDGRPHAQLALEAATALAARDGAEVHALGVATPPQGLVSPVGISAVAALEAERDRMERCIADLPETVTASAVDGLAHQKLAELSAEVDVLVVGSSRRGTIGRVLLGSTAEALSREAACPLLVVTAPASSPPGPGQPDRSASAPAA